MNPFCFQQPPYWRVHHLRAFTRGDEVTVLMMLLQLFVDLGPHKLEDQHPYISSDPLYLLELTKYIV